MVEGVKERSAQAIAQEGPKVLGERDRPGLGRNQAVPGGTMRMGLLRGAYGSRPHWLSPDAVQRWGVVTVTDKALLHVGAVGSWREQQGRPTEGPRAAQNVRSHHSPKGGALGSMRLGVSRGCARLRVRQGKPG